MEETDIGLRTDINALSGNLGTTNSIVNDHTNKITTAIGNAQNAYNKAVSAETIANSLRSLIEQTGSPDYKVINVKFEYNYVGASPNPPTFQLNLYSIKPQSGSNDGVDSFVIPKNYTAKIPAGYYYLPSFFGRNAYDAFIDGKQKFSWRYIDNDFGVATDSTAVNIKNRLKILSRLVLLDHDCTIYFNIA